jgi:hypothetical protein
MVIRNKSNSILTVKQSSSGLTRQDLESSTSSFNVHDLPFASKAAVTASPRAVDHIDECDSCTTKPKKSVSFNEIVKYREILHIKNMTRRQREKLWETNDSLTKIRQEAVEIVGLMNCGLELSYDVGQRGLTCLSSEEKAKRTATREEAFDAVFLLQEFQYDLWCLFDDQGDITERIGQRYAQLCEEARKEAMIRGQRDHEEAVDAKKP